MVVGSQGPENIGEIEGIRRGRRGDCELELGGEDGVKDFLMR